MPLRRLAPVLGAVLLGLALPDTARAFALRPSPSGAASYGESFTFVGDLDDGTYVHLSLSLTNLGPGGLKGLCRAAVVAPSGEVWKGSARVGRDEIAWKPGSAELLSIGPCSASLAGASLTAEVRLDGGSATLVFGAAPLARSPHGAVAVVGNDLYRSEVLYQRAPVEAALAIGGAPRKLSGRGYADHSRSTVAGKELAQRWVRFRGLHDERGLLLLGREAKDGQFTPLWSCGAAPGTCREYVSFRVERGGSEVAPSFTVAVKGDASSLELRSTKLLLREAPVEDLGVLGKLVAPFVGSPVTYTFRATAAGEGGAPSQGILEVELDGE